MSALATICVCDDEPDVREMLQEYLTKRGFDVVPVGDGDSLRAAMTDHMIDLILLDINMPGEDGADNLANLAFDRPDTGRHADCRR